MKPIRRTFLSTALAFCLFCMTTFALVTSASAHTTARNQASSGKSALSPNSGGDFNSIDLNAYCQSLGYTGVALDGGTVYDWHCVDQNGNHVGFSLKDACYWEESGGWFGDFGADRVGNFYDPYSVRCFSGSEVGGLDLNAYCQTLGYTGATLDGSTAYDWVCVDQNGNYVGFSMTSACQWQYNDSSVFDRFDNFYDAFSIQCWGFGHPE